MPEHQTLFIPNVTTDVGLSPPFNGLFTIFGQFFDHGLDKITNGGAGTVFVPLKADDPLVLLGPDGIAGTNCGTSSAANCDEVPPGLRFMTLTRGTIVTGPDGNRSAPNTDTPFVDQSQTYTSHSSHQVFLREYAPSAGGPLATGKFLSRPDGEGMATWSEIKAQASTLLGLQLLDTDVNDIPLIAADVYGNFIPGPPAVCPRSCSPTTRCKRVTRQPTVAWASAWSAHRASARRSSTTSLTRPAPVRQPRRRPPTPTSLPAAASTPRSLRASTTTSCSASTSSVVMAGATRTSR